MAFGWLSWNTLFSCNGQTWLRRTSKAVLLDFVFNDFGPFEPSDRRSEAVNVNNIYTYSLQMIIMMRQNYEKDFIISKSHKTYNRIALKAHQLHREWKLAIIWLPATYKLDGSDTFPHVFRLHIKYIKVKQKPSQITTTIPKKMFQCALFHLPVLSFSAMILLIIASLMQFIFRQFNSFGRYEILFFGNRSICAQNKGPFIINKK